MSAMQLQIVLVHYLLGGRVFVPRKYLKKLLLFGGLVLIPLFLLCELRGDIFPPLFSPFLPKTGQKSIV
jgi:hypothetical protein